MTPRRRLKLYIKATFVVVLFFIGMTHAYERLNSTGERLSIEDNSTNDFKSYLPKRGKTYGEIMQLAIMSPEVEKIGSKLLTAMQENPGWFFEYIKKSKEGEPLPTVFISAPFLCDGMVLPYRHGSIMTFMDSFPSATILNPSCASDMLNLCVIMSFTLTLL